MKWPWTTVLEIHPDMKKHIESHRVRFEVFISGDDILACETTAELGGLVLAEVHRPFKQLLKKLKDPPI